MSNETLSKYPVTFCDSSYIHLVTRPWLKRSILITAVCLPISKNKLHGQFSSFKHGRNVETIAICLRFLKAVYVLREGGCFTTSSGCSEQFYNDLMPTEWEMFQKGQFSCKVVILNE